MGRFERDLDEHIAGGRFRRETVRVKCAEHTCGKACDDDECSPSPQDCGWEGNGSLDTEYGFQTLTPEDCPLCGGEVEICEE